MYPYISPKGPSSSKSSSGISPSMIISTLAGTMMSEFSHLTTSTGFPLNPPAISSSSWPDRAVFELLIANTIGSVPSTTATFACVSPFSLCAMMAFQPS